MRVIRWFGAGLAAFVIAVLVFNSSWFAPPDPDAHLRFIAHRGVHQTFGRDGLTNETCTAERIYPPTHDMLENTVASAQAAFDAGADVVEFDIAPTRDGQLAVFHDWTVDCRTDGRGDTRDLTLAELKALDIGYGYTADQGRTHPFRGQGIGLMPEISEMFAQTRGGRFLINFKSNSPEEGDMIAAVIAANEDWRQRVWSAYGGQVPVDRANSLVAGLNGFGTRSARNCLFTYIITGWAGAVPDDCRNTKIMVPGNLAFLLWGWPNLFLERMRAVNSEVILLGPISGDAPGTVGIDTEADLSLIPPYFDGYVWTNKIETIAPLLRKVRTDQNLTENEGK